MTAAQTESSSAFKSLSSSAESTTGKVSTAPHKPLCALAPGTCLIRRWLIRSDSQAFKSHAVMHEAPLKGDGRVRHKLSRRLKTRLEALPFT